MSTQQVKFYKFSNSSTSSANITTAKGVAGAIIYIADIHELWIGGSTPELIVKGASDVTFNNNILTITQYTASGSSTSQTLDFSDVASSSATLKVFEKVYNMIGATTDGTNKKLDYSGTNYISTTTTLVDADKALDTQIKAQADALNALDSTASIASVSEGIVTIKNGLTQIDGLVENNTNSDITLAKIATTGESTDVAKSTNSSATYNTTATEISSNWVSVVNNNTLADGDTVDADLNKLDNKVAGLADELINDEQTTTNAFNSVKSSVGLENNFSLNLSSDTTNIIKTDTNVKDALLHLASQIDSNELDVQINSTSIKSNNVANIAADGAYNSTDNKLATVSTVTTKIDAISGAGLEVSSSGTITATTQAAGDSTTNVATTAFVTTAINALDATVDADNASDATIPTTTTTPTTDFKVLNSVTETDGKLSSATAYNIKKVAATGKAEDVSITDADGKITATNVEGALQELATNIASLAGGMRYNGDISSATATLNTTTNDIRPGDIYLASGTFTIGTTSVEAGDMIVYKGTTSTETVTLTTSNSTVIERETDTMVTAGDTLSDNYIVFGNGNKEVSVTSTVSDTDYQVTASDLKTAITNANSALQSIAKGTDGTYVTTTVGTKDTNKQQTIGVAVTQSTVTYTAKSEDTPANLTATDGLLNEDAVDAIKSYIDAQKASVTNSNATITVNAANATTLATIDGTNITAKAELYWESYE